MDRLEKKVAESKKRGKKITARRAEWEELNEKIVGGGGARAGKAAPAGEGKGVETKDGIEIEVVKPALDVELPDLEQPLPVRVAGSETGDTQQGDSDNADDLDDVT